MHAPAPRTPDHAGEFNTEVFALLTRFEKKAKSTNERGLLSRMRNRIVTAISYEKTALLESAAPVLMEFSDEILNENKTARDAFFLTLDIRGEYTKRAKTEDKASADDEYIFELVDIVRGHYKNSTPEEQDAIHKSVKKMIAVSAGFLLAS